jgi:glycosyltransferase involved in cell wall biosynthesis
LLEDKNLRLQMSAAAARHIVQFNWDRITEDWAKVFAQAVDKRHRD